MPNKWTEWVKKWASDNNTTYGCALSNPKCRDDYRAKYGDRKKLSTKKEIELMGAEDRPARQVSEKDDLHELIKSTALNIKSRFEEDPDEVNKVANEVMKTLLGYTKFDTALDKIKYMIYQIDNKGLKAKVLQTYYRTLNKYLKEGETKRVDEMKKWLESVSRKLEAMSTTKINNYRKKLYDKLQIDSFKDPLPKDKFISMLKILSGANEPVFSELNKLIN